MKKLFVRAVFVMVVFAFVLSAKAMAFEAQEFSEGRAAFTLDDEKYGFIDDYGDVVIEPVYDEVSDFSEGLAYVFKDDKYGFIDLDGEVVIPLQYDSAFCFNEGLAGVCLNGKWGFINEANEIIVPIEYAYVVEYSEGLACVWENDPINGRIGYFDTEGNQVIPFKYFDTLTYESHFSGGLAAVKNAEGKCGYIDKNGNVVIPFQYVYADAFEDGLACVGLEWSNRGAINSKGEIVIPFEHYGVISSGDGYFIVDGDNHDYCFDSKGNLIYQTESRATLYVPGEGRVAAVQKSTGKWGYLDMAGNLVIDYVYYQCSVFSEGVAVVATSGNYGIIDRIGNTLIPFEYDFISSFNEGCAVALRGGQIEVLYNPAQNPFVDVNVRDWYYKSLRYAKENSLMAGTSATTFAPNLVLSRAMLVTILYRAAGSPEVEPMYAAHMMDVKQGSWYEDAMGWAVKESIISGYGESLYGPNDPITREQLVTVLYRYADSPELTAGTLEFDDAGDVSDWAIDAFVWATGEGIVSGKPGSLLDPQGTATRAETAAVLMRFMTAP